MIKSDKILPCRCGNKKPLPEKANNYIEKKYRIVCYRCYKSSEIFALPREAINDWNLNYSEALTSDPILDPVEILSTAVAFFGQESQINMAIEEAGELITALAKRDRAQNGSTVDEIIGEMAGMQIMLEQLKQIYDNGDNFKKAVDKKLLKLKILIAKEKDSE